MGLGWELLEAGVLAGGAAEVGGRLSGGSPTEAAVRRVDELLRSRMTYVPPELRARADQERPPRP